MALYSALEIKDILLQMSKEPPSQKVKFIQFERLGVKPNPINEDHAGQEEVLLHVCSVCKKILMSAHLLELHVVEQHDSYFDLQKDKKPMYACFLEECKHMSQTSESRKDHCIKAHKFPHNFRFSSKMQKSSSVEQMDTSEKIVEEATSSKPKPINLHFGHKTQKVFMGKPKKDPIKTMNDLKESLPNI